MAESIQEYYEKLIAQQSGSIRKNLIKYGLTEWDKVSPTLTQKEREYILSRYRNGVIIQAVTFFRQIVTRAQLKRSAIIKTFTYSQENKRLFEILFDDLSIRAQHTLLNNDINSIEDLAPWIEGELDGFLQFEKCGRRTSEELMAMVLRLRGFVEASSQPVCEDDSIDGEEHVPTETEETETVNISERNERIFELLFDDLSRRAQNILIYHDLNSIEKLAPWIQGKYDSFLQFRNCGKQTSEELMEMVLYLRAKVDLSCQPSVERDLEDQNEGNRLLNNTIAIVHENKIRSQRYFEYFLNSLSVRTRNVLSANGIADCESFLVMASQPIQEIIKCRNCGEKTAQEILEVANKLQAVINETGATDEDSISSFYKIIQLDETCRAYLTTFKREQGHWPMFFILLSKMNSILTSREFAAFEDKYGIQKHKELEELSKQRVQQLFTKASIKLKRSSPLKQLCKFGDWDLYHVDDIPVPVLQNEFEDSSWRDMENMILLEKNFCDNYFREKVSTEEETRKRSKLLVNINLSTFKVFLQFWGHKPLWLKNNSLVPYCPQEKIGYQDPQSPIVIDKRFASFKFSKALTEIGRLKKEKIANDIILSVENHFVDNEDYWNSSVNLPNEDKATLVLILKELFGNICHAVIVDDNLVFRTNRFDLSDKLYEILSMEGTRLHRDELFIRLKKMCNENGLRFNYTNSSQIIPFLVKDPRIIPYGKSSYWGLKEWGETFGSIRELALRMTKESAEPIHIDALTKLIMESRPDSNEKSITAIIRQTTSTGELLLFWGDYIGYPNAKYIHEFIIMPRSFDEWLKAFKEFVINNKRYPSNDKDFEGFLNRWYQKAIKLTDLSAEEILKIDALEKELTHYPHNTIEYNFLHKCNLYKKFVEGNNRMLEETDDRDLYKWFNSASLNYSSFKDNRNRYFSQLLQYLSSKLY